VKPGLALLPLLLGGCDILFELRPVPSPDGHANADALAPADVQTTSDGAAGCTFIDNFTGSALSPSWELIDPSQSTVIVTEESGQLTITPKVSSNGSNGVITAMTHDLRDMVVTVVVSPASEAGGVQTGLYIGPDTNNYAAIETGNNTVNLRVMTTVNNQSSNVSYDPAARWWRIRHSTATGLTYFSFSTDGSMFAAEIGYNMGFSMAAVKMSMAVIVTGQTNPGQAHFDDFTVCAK
jgi:hypothetical protein